MAEAKYLQQCYRLISERYLQICVTVFVYQKSLKIQTTDKVIRVHAEKALSRQPFRMSTANVYSLL